MLRRPLPTLVIACAGLGLAACARTPIDEGAGAGGADGGGAGGKGGADGAAGGNGGSGGSGGSGGQGGAGGGAGSKDGGVDAKPTDGAMPDVPDHDPYTDPGDFADCPGTGTEKVSPAGIWTTRVTRDGNSGVVMHQFAAGPVDGQVEAPPQMEAMGLRGWLGGTAITRIVQTPGVLYWSRVTDSMMGEHRVVAFRACSATPDDMVGQYSVCINGECYPGEFHAIRLERIASESESAGVTLLAEHSGAGVWADGITVNVRVADGFAYLARYQDGLRVIDVHDAAAGKTADVGHVATPKGDGYDIWNDVKIVGNRWILMGSSARGLVVVDAADPAKPEIAVDRFPDLGRNVHSIFVQGDRAYLADISIGGIVVADISDPSAPKMLGEFSLGKSFVHDLTVDGDRAYLNYWDVGTVVVDVSDPAKITELGTFTYGDPSTSHASWRVDAAGRKVLLNGDEDWGAHLRIIDVDPGSGGYLSEVGSLSFRDHVSIHNILCRGATCFIAWYQDGLRIVDMSEPTKPTLVGYFNTWQGKRAISFYEGAIGVDEVDGLVYVADSERDLLVFKRN